MITAVFTIKQHVLGTARDRSSWVVRSEVRLTVRSAIGT